MESKKKFSFMKIDNYNIYKPALGKGAFGAVYLAEEENNKEVFACKMISLDLVATPSDRKMIHREITNSLYMDHPHINKILFIKRTKNDLLLFSHLCSGGDLSVFSRKYFLRYKTLMHDDIIAYFAKQIIIGLYYLSMVGIAHRDIKLANIIITNKDKRVCSEPSNILEWENFKEMMAELPVSKESKEIGMEKDFVPYDCFQDIESNLENIKLEIIDFGFSVCLNLTTMKSFLGTPATVAPEIVKKQKYDIKCDIWSLGCILFKLKTYQNPFPGKTIEELFENVDKGEIVIPKGAHSVQFLDLIERVLKFDPNERLSLAECLQHPFFTDRKDFIELDEPKKVSLKSEGLKAYLKEKMDSDNFDVDFDLGITLEESEITEGESQFVLITFNYN